MTTQSGVLGVGLYTPAQAARYARIVTTKSVNRWVWGDSQGLRVIDAQLGGDPDKLITFIDFVQILAIRSIRREFDVSLQKIREAVHVARDRYNVESPFAMPHMTYLFQGNIHILRPGDDDLTQVSGRGKHQMVARKVAELYMQDLHFADDRPVSYDAFKYEKRTITMDPTRQFGQPLLDNGHSAEALIHAYRTEGSIEAAANVMGVEVEDVSLALRYDDSLLVGKVRIPDAA